MKLTNKDKKFLLGIGVPKEDLQQIEEASNKCDVVMSYVFFNKRKQCKQRVHKRKSSLQAAIKRLGRQNVLPALDRAAFHWTGVQTMGDYIYYFDCARYFRS